MNWTGRLLKRTEAIASAPPMLSETGTLPTSARVALWVHWEHDGRVSEADLGMLRHLRDLGHAVVAVGNRDDQGSEDFEASLQGVADVVLQRRNVGYDFAGFRDGLMWLRPHLLPGTTLLMLNNSTYGPFGSLGPMLAEADPERADVWAATGSLEVQPHVQSWFVVVHPKALATPGFWKHWSGVKPPVEKMRVVYECEVPLAVKLHNQGLRVRALRPYHGLARLALDRQVLVAEHVGAPGYAHVVHALRKGRPLNPTHHLWRWLLDSGVPLIKKDLLRVNPPGLPDVADWARLVPGEPFVRDAVAADLAAYRTGAARPAR